ncbi:uncharacterized protein Hap1MRO34_005167 isoform 1-T1 [Clarias gariepinus]
MEIACTEMTRAVAGAKRQREEHRVNKQNECTMTWNVPKLDVCKEEEGVSGESTGDVCVLCGGHFAFPTHQTEHVDEVCCHLCQVKFSQKNLLALHLKNAHPKSSMLCTMCTVHMGQNLTKDQNVESNVTQNKNKFLLDEEMDEVVGRMNETEENSITNSTEDYKTISLHDHSYASSPTCRSIRETQNNVVMYTSSENVLVFVNETDKTSPKGSYTKSDQQRTSVDDRTVCSGIHDHNYFSIQNLANHMLPHKTLPSPNNVINSINKDIDVCNSKAETTLSPKDPSCTLSDLDQIGEDELVCMGLLDHTYFFRPRLSNHTVLSKQVPSHNTFRLSTHKKEMWKNQDNSNRVTVTDQESSQWTSGAMLESLQLKCNKKQIQEDVVGEYEVIIQGSDHEDSDTLSADDLAYISDDDLDSDTDSCTSYTSCTNSNAGTLGKGCTSESWSACQKPNCENTNPKSPSPVDYKNPNPAPNLNKDLRIWSSCGLHKVHTKGFTERSTCTQPFICSLCEILFSTKEMLLNHQEKKHILPTYMCVSCLEQSPTQEMFMQHVCSKSKESLTPSISSNNAKDLAGMILDVVPSSAAAAESSKQALSTPSVSIIDTAQNKNPCTVLNSTSHSSPTSQSTSTTQKLPVQVTATGSSSCAQKVVTGLVNGNQGQDKLPIFTVNQKQIGQVQVLRPLPSKVVTQTRSPSSPILLTSQCQGQKAHQIGQVQVLSQLQAKVATQPPSPSSTTQILSSQGRGGQVQDLSPLPVKVVTFSSSFSTTTGATPIVLSSQGQGQVPPISKFIQEQIKQVQVLSKLQAKVASQPPSFTTQILSSQGRVKIPPVSTVTQKQFGQVQDSSPLQVRVVTKTTASSTITPTTTGATPIVLSPQGQGQVPPISKFLQEQTGHVQVLSSLHPKVLSQPSSFVSSTQIPRSSQGHRKMPHKIREVQVLGQLQAKVEIQPPSPSPSSTTQILSSQGRVKMPPVSTVTQKQFGQVQDSSPLQVKVVTKTTASSTTTPTTTGATPIVLSPQGQGQVPPISKVLQEQTGHVQVLSSLHPKVLSQPSSFVSSTQILRSSQGHRKMPHKIREVQVLGQLQAKVEIQPPSPSSTTQILSSQGRVKMPPVSTVTQKQFGQVQDSSPLQVKVVTKTTASSTTTPTTTGATPIVLSPQGQGQVPPISKVLQEQTGHVQVLSSLHPKVLSQPSSFVSSTQIPRSSQGHRKMPHKIREVQVLGQLQAKVEIQPPSSSSTTQILSSQGRVEMPPISTVTQKQFGQVRDLKTTSSSSSSSSTTTPTTTATTQILCSSQGHGKVPPISKFTHEQNRPLQVLHSLQPKVVTQTPPLVHNTQILHSSQDHRQMTPISTVTHIESAQVQDLTPLHTSTSSAKLPASKVLPQQRPSFGIHLPHPFQSSVSNSVSVPSKTSQLSKSNVPLLDICKSSLSTPIITSSQEPLKIVAMFMNQSRELALQKRLCQSWRSKAVFPCRQCGAVSRQFSLGVRHRYQHRGPRLHRCQCGRAFEQLMHLLRHQVQHAEATRYVCATCGQMFCGTQQLACHRPLFRITASKREKQTNKKCRNTFQCYCGRSFMRPAALLWHMLKNPKDRKPHLKSFRIS